MYEKDSILYSFFFSLALTFVFVFILAFINNRLSSRIELGKEVRLQRSILDAMNISYDKNDLEGINARYSELKKYTFVRYSTEDDGTNIKPIVYDNFYAPDMTEEKYRYFLVDEGNQIAPEGIVVDEFNLTLLSQENIFVSKAAQGEVVAKIFQGPGLWGQIRGVLSYDRDITQTKGFSIISMSETPGLGARIEEPWFVKQLQGKTIVQDRIQVLVGSSIGSGAESENGSKDDRPGVIDGITGATVTSISMQNIFEKEIPLMKILMKKIEEKEANV